MSDSVHTARWISQIADEGWDLHLLPSIDYGLSHPDLYNIRIHHSFYGKKKNGGNNIKFSGIPVIDKSIASIGRGIYKKIKPDYRAYQLKRLIKKIRPDIIHSMEIQAGGYLTLDAYECIKNKFPPWIVTNWGSDIYLFGRLSEHSSKIQKVMAACDYYSCECHRDVKLAQRFDFKGKILPVLPNSGGLDFNKVLNLRHTGPVSTRRRIILKGYQNWSGRALVGLRAIERCADLLQNYEILIFSATPDVMIAAELFQKTTGIKTTIIPIRTPHADILKHHGQARIYIGLSISDALSTSAIEALAMGAFPIQSFTSCIDEWVDDGRTGILVPPDDPDVIENALRKALTDDDLVDNAAEINYQLAKERLDYISIKNKVIALYQSIAREKGF